MRQVFTLFLVLLCIRCSIIKPTRIEGTYKSSCVLYGSPDLIVNFKQGGNFVYKMPYVEEIIGTWVVRRDTLILYSDEFSNQLPSESTPANKYNKYTDLEGKKDAYLVKGEKLYPINKAGHTKSCYLKRQ